MSRENRKLTHFRKNNPTIGLDCNVQSYHHTAEHCSARTTTGTFAFIRELLRSHLIKYLGGKVEQGNKKTYACGSLLTSLQEWT